MPRIGAIVLRLGRFIERIQREWFPEGRCGWQAAARARPRIDQRRTRSRTSRAVLVIALASVLAGCSFFTAGVTNNPRTGCSRTSARLDAGIALAGLAGIVALTANVLIDPPDPDAHNPAMFTRVAIGGLGVLSLFEAIQASYGFGVNRRCQATRAKLQPAPPWPPERDHHHQ